MMHWFIATSDWGVVGTDCLLLISVKHNKFICKSNGKLNCKWRIKIGKLKIGKYMQLGKEMVN